MAAHPSPNPNPNPNPDPNPDLPLLGHVHDAAHGVGVAVVLLHQRAAVLRLGRYRGDIGEI